MSKTLPTVDEIFALTPHHDICLPFRQNDRLFDTLHDISLLMSAIGIASGAVVNGGLIDTAGKTIALISDHLQKKVSISVGDTFQLAMQEKRPDEILLTISQVTPPPYPTVMSTHGFDSIMHRTLLLPIAAFFDQHLRFLQSRSTDSYQWPEPFNFYRVVRNGIAHRGLVDFRTSSAQPVSWRGISFSHTDHQSRLISAKFFVADAILLMLDACCVLDELEAPR